MARRTYPYSPITLPPTAPFPNGQTVYRPLLIARVTAANGNSLLSIAEVDSGADQCVFPLSFAIALGLDPLTMKQQITGGVGNAGNLTYYSDITIELGIIVDAHTMKFEPHLTFKTYAGFTLGLDAQGIGLLGEVDFFENYVVTLDHKNRVFHIE